MKTLIIHQGALGDVLLSFPGLDRLRNSLGGELELWCQSQTGRLACEVGIADHTRPAEGRIMASLYSPDPGPDASALLCPYDNVVLFSFSRELEENVAGLCPRSSVVRIPPRPAPGERTGVADHLVRGLVESGLLPENEAGAPVRSRTRRGESENRNPNLVVLHPGSGSPRKCWPVQRFVELDNALRGEGMECLFVVGPAELHMGRFLVDEGVLPDNVLETTNLTHLVDLLESAGGYVGNDSGVTHLAAFMGVPTTAVFGPSDPARWSPVGPRVSVIRPETECAPCFEVERTNCDRPSCLEHTSVDDVLAGCMSLMGS
ncbi:MAG: glycosyltransferase family 9 protein [Desulfatibacillaceae bacterium]